MKSSNEYTNPEFDALFKFDFNEDEIKHEAEMIMFRFLSEIERINDDKPIKKKELAKILGTSASYITQLYNGDKLINLPTLAKLQKAYNITFKIIAVPSDEGIPSPDVGPDMAAGTTLPPIAVGPSIKRHKESFVKRNKKKIKTKPKN